MGDFINTVDVLGDEALTDSIIDRSVTEYRDNTITSVGYGAFNGCQSLTIVATPVVTSIDGYAFNGCYRLASVEVPEATSIGDNAFYDCAALQIADFQKATSIGQTAFQRCAKLTTANFPLLTSLVAGSQAGIFTSCTALNSINFPVLTSISNNMFKYCSALQIADFPSVTSVGSNAFDGCSNLVTLILRNTAQVVTISNIYSLNSTPINSGTGYIYVPSALVDSYKAATNWSTFANQIRAIEDYPEITGG